MMHMMHIHRKVCADDDEVQNEVNNDDDNNNKMVNTFVVRVYSAIGSTARYTTKTPEREGQLITPRHTINEMN